MLFGLSDAEARGRAYAAGRMMAGLDQATLARRARVSAGTISNIERGREARLESLRAVRRALRRAQVAVFFDAELGLANVSMSFTNDEEA